MSAATIIFLDIVGFSKNPNTRQRELVDSLTSEVTSSLSSLINPPLETPHVVAMPTGDGMALAFLHHPNQPWDISTIMSLIYRVKQWAKSRDGALRIGVHAGEVEFINDVNKKTNIVGDTINYTQRVMDTANPKQVLFSDVAFRQYIGSNNPSYSASPYGPGYKAVFEGPFDVLAKHGMRMLVYKMTLDPPQEWLSNDDPVAHQSPESIVTGKETTQQMPADTRPPASIGTQKTPKTVANPIYRRVFVGREPELKQLQSVFDSAISGKGALAVVVGEPGIGKTSLCEQLAAYVTLRGGKTLFGQCYEKGSLSLPYLAFVEALRSYVLNRPPDDLRKEMGAGAGDVARIIPEVRERLNIDPPKVGGDPEEDRYRLMQSVTDFLVNASAVQPLLIILEDLHDADKGTLEMLTHIGRHLAGARLLIVGTYRDVEVDRTHPLSGFLAELRRISSFTRVALRGLTSNEVQRMLQNVVLSGAEGVVEQDIPWGLAEQVYRQTEGNPLFVQEVLRYLVEEGLIGRKDGQGKAGSQTTITIAIPEGLRDVIGKRLSRLSPSCNRVLSFAAVVGRNFSLVILQKVVTATEDELYSALEEATSAGVLDERSAVGKGSSFFFAHAFFRQTLYEELFAPRRIRTHQQVGRAMEEVYAQRLEEHAAELAAHFSQSTESSDLAKAVKYGELAAKRAISVYAYSEAVRLYEECLKAQEVLDPDDKAKQCDLLLALGEALFMAGEPRRCIDEAATKAFALAEAMSDNRRRFSASHLAYEGLGRIGQLSAVNTPEGKLWVERADRYATPDSRDRVWADLILGNLKRAQNQRREARRLYKHGMDLARRLEDDEAFLRLAGQWLFYSSQLADSAERLSLAEEAVRIPRAGLSIVYLPGVLSILANVFLQMGQRQRVEDLFSELRTGAERTRQVSIILSEMRARVILATIEGRLEEAIDIIQQMLAKGIEMGIAPSVTVQLLNGPERALLEFGQVEQALGLVQGFAPDDSLVQVATALFQAHIGRSAEVAEILSGRVLANTDETFSADTSEFGFDLKLLEASVLIEHKEAATQLLKRFRGDAPPPFASQSLVCTFRLLGAAKALLGKNEEARADYKEALRVSTDFKFRPEVALTRLGIAELLLAHYPAEKKEALEHLDFAIKEFREMKMQPSLERALRQKTTLKA